MFLRLVLTLSAVDCKPRFLAAVLKVQSVDLSTCTRVEARGIPLGLKRVDNKQHIFDIGFVRILGS